MQVYRKQRKSERRPRLFRSLGMQLLVYALLLFSTPPFLSAAVFQIPAGDVPGLIAAINVANANGEENTIILEPGIYTLTAVDNNTNIGPGNPFSVQANGLPVLTSKLTLRGAGAEVTSIERDENAPGFRIVAVTAGGTLTLDGLTIRGGDARAIDADGGGVASEGTVTITNSTITQNRSGSNAGGGGVLNGGTMSIIRSTIANNAAIRNSGGGVLNGGTMTIHESTIANNTAVDAGAGGIVNGGSLLITNSTIVDNQGDDGGGIQNRGTLTVTNSTISRNHATFGFGTAGGGGINVVAGAVTLQNTILALNTVGQFGFFDDCRGPITSLGNNLIGVNCGIALQPSDVTGDPGLGDFTDDGAPGNGRFPLLSGSAAINAGNDSACPVTDQLGTPRNGRCDIGAVEFYPVVNDLVALANLTTAFDPTPVPGGPAGTFLITATFTNTSNQAIVHPFAEVIELTGENLLLNANGGAGGAGARLTLPNSATTPFEPGASRIVEFLIGLQKQEPFTFFVNMLGDPRSSNSFVNKR